ncbi:MAG: HXXEE domain-containing protein, partial [Phenylobacterium sp.]
RVLSGSPDERRKLASRLLLAALVAHDLEEAIGYGLQRPMLLERLPLLLPTPLFWAALAVATVAGGALLLWAGSGPASPGRTAALRTIAAILLVNVLVPHAPVAWWLGGYAPGVITAVLVNIPVGLTALALVRRL